MFSAGSNADTETSAPVVNGIANNAVLHYTPHIYQTLPRRVTDILHFSVVDSLLNYVSDFVVNWKPCCSATTKINLAYDDECTAVGFTQLLRLISVQIDTSYTTDTHYRGQGEISQSRYLNSVFVAGLYWPSPPFVQFSDYPLRENSVSSLQELLKCAQSIINHIFLPEQKLATLLNISTNMAGYRKSCRAHQAGHPL